MKKQIKRPLSDCCGAPVSIQCEKDRSIPDEDVKCIYVCYKCHNQCNVNFSHIKDGDQSPIDKVNYGKL